jgi:sugar phosphate isomerase/epimerase
MPKNVHIGFNLSHGWLTGRDFETVVAPLQEAGLGALELLVEFRYPEYGDHVEWLCEQAKAVGLGLSFHAPFQDPPFAYGFSRENRTQIEQDWQPVLDLLNRYAGTNGIRSELTLHGVHGAPDDMEGLFMDTVEQAKWLLESCPEIYLGIENLPVPRNPDALRKFGEDRESVLEALRLVDHPRCGITWDMGHCVRDKVLENPTAEWVREVIHVHVHDVDDSRQDHWPFILGSTPYERWISYLLENGFTGTITAELSGGLYTDWPQEKIDRELLHTLQEIKTVVDKTPIP